jgi:hypothetical protein
MKRKLIYRIICILLFPAAVAVNYLSHRDAGLTERIYSMGAYRFFSVIFSNISGIFPFSVMEVFLILIVLLFFIYLSILIFRKKKKAKKKSRKEKAAGIFELITIPLAIVGTVYFLFIVLWGLNYNRRSAFEIFGLKKQEVTLDKLYEIGTDLKDKLNQLVSDISDSDLELNNVIGRGNLGYFKIQDKYPALGGNYTNVKPVMLSVVMSYFQIWGIYSPFSFEANINSMIPGPLLPSTIAHELAHVRGFAREDEANFIAYLACVNHHDAAYIYSGSLLAYINIINAVRSTDTDAADNLNGMLDPAVIEHLREIGRFNARYKSILNDIADRVNDIFLKSNRQTEGVKSYGRMVDLITAYYFRDQPG